MTTPATGRTLMLLRHAKAEEGHHKRDQDRELAPRGRADARAVGQWLSDPSQTVALDLVMCSTSQRTRQTLDGLCAGGASVEETLFEKRIYEASAASLLDLLREVSDSVHAVLMIGHAPGIPTLVTTLARGAPGSPEAIDRLAKGFPTASLAILEVQGRWAELGPETAYLRDFVVPRG